MKRFLLAVLLLVSCRCATTKNPYAYNGVMSEAECEAQCGSYGYLKIGVIDGGCQCDTSSCARSLGLGGCEKLPAPPR